MLKSFFDLTAMDDAVDEMVTALDNLSADEFEMKIDKLSGPARFLAKMTIHADLESNPDPERAEKLLQIISVLELA